MFKEAVSSFHHHWKSWTNIFLCCDPIKIDTSINVVFILFFLCFWFCASMRRFWVISMWRQWVLCTSRRCLISYLSVCQCLWCFSPCFVHASVNFPFTILINLRIQFLSTSKAFDAAIHFHSFEVYFLEPWPRHSLQTFILKIDFFYFVFKLIMSLLNYLISFIDSKKLSQVWQTGLRDITHNNKTNNACPRTMLMKQ